MNIRARRVGVMKPHLTFLLALSISATVYTGGWVKPIDITGQVPDSVKRIASLIEEMARDISSCVNAGNKRETCICKHRSQHEKLRTMYKQVIREHPQWADKTVSYRERDMQRMVSFAGIKMQLQYFDKTCK